jgi:acyl-CoA hydrolase
MRTNSSSARSFCSSASSQVLLRGGLALMLGVGNCAQAVVDLVVDVPGHLHDLLDRLLFETELGEMPLQFLV